MFTLRSSAFRDGGEIPERFTCDGDDRSPPLAWSDPPESAASFALIVDDPDAPDPAAPRRLWVHWLLYNIPAAHTELAEGAGNQVPPSGAQHAITDAHTHGYHGPCPPIGKHRYFFHLAAIDCTLPDLGQRARRADLERAIAGHVLATAVLMGTYERPAAAAR